MQPPQVPPPPGYGPPPGAVPARDNTTLFGVLGIVLGLICCGILGVVFGILSIQSAKKVGKPQTLGIIAIVCGAIGLVWNIIATVNFNN